MQKRLTNEDNGSNQNQQKSNDMQVLWQDSVSLVGVKRFFCIMLFSIIIK